jgi:hypothetical protein
MMIALAKTSTGLSASQLAFYATAATVIPVLLLALAVRGAPARVISHIAGVEHLTKRSAGVTKLIALALLTLIVTGEILALTALKNDRVASGTLTFVLLALVVAVLAVVFDVIGRVFSQIDELIGDATTANAGSDSEQPEQNPGDPAA